MTVKTKPLDFYEAAVASQEPRGNYSTALELLDDLPAIVMKRFGTDGARVVAYMVKRSGDVWRRSDRQWFEQTVAFATNALRNPDLGPDQRAHLAVVALVGGVFDAVEKQKAL
jgi:hypothetical protein